MTKNDNESNGTANSSSVDASDSVEDDVAVTPPQDPGEPDPESMRQDLPKTKEGVPDISCAAPVVVVVESDTKPLLLGYDGGEKVDSSTVTTLLESPRVKLEPWDETEPVIHVTERTTVPQSSIDNILSVDDFSKTNHDTNASLQIGEQQAAEGTAEMEESEQPGDQLKVKAVQVENDREEPDAKAVVEQESKIVEGEEQHQMETRPNADAEEVQGAEQQRPETDAIGTEQALENVCREECPRQEAKAEEEVFRKEADAKAQEDEAERMRNHTDAVEITEKEQLKQDADAKEVVAIDELIDVRSAESVDVEEAELVQVASESTVMRGIVDSPSDELGSPIMMDRALSKSNSNILNQANAQTTVSELADESTLVQETIAGINPALPQTVVDEEERKKAQSHGSTNAFKQTFSSTYIKPPPIQTTRQAESSTKQTPRGLTFAQAFGSKPASIVSPLATPRSENKESSAVPVDPPTSTKSVGSSHSALSASKNKKVQVLMSKYMEGVAHQPLPGDSIPLRKIDSEASPACSTSFASQDTPLSAQSIQEKVAVTEIELAKLPKISSVLEKFESSSKSAGSNTVFEFGEHFRQKQRFELLSEKEKAKEAKVALHGFNERDLFPGKVAAGEIDTSSLGKVYTFEMSTNMSRDLPVDGICRVNYKIADYTAMVFVVHRTRGMLLLHIGSAANQKRQVPSGVVLEREFLEAAQKSGSANVQLQIAAREAAGRQLFDNTGLDIRNQVDRFKPAILRLNPPVDAKGVQYLKNEYNNRLYYFLQVDEDDFTSIAHTGSSDKLSRPSEDPGDTALTLRLRDDFDGFAFVLDPSDAAKILKEDGDLEATSALYMIMSEASESISKNSPDAKATEYSVVDSVPDDEKADWLESTGNIRTVGEKEQGLGKLRSGNGMTSFHDEADLKIKTSLDTNEHTDGVACCCGWW